MLSFTRHPRLVRLVIAEDNLPLRQTMVSVLNALPDLEVVGEADNGYETVEVTRDIQPDILLMDLQMPGLCGLEVIRQLVADQAGYNVICLANENDQVLIGECIKAGAKAFSLKGGSIPQLYQTIRQIKAGEFQSIAHPASFPELTAS